MNGGLSLINRLQGKGRERESGEGEEGRGGGGSDAGTVEAGEDSEEQGDGGSWEKLSHRWWLAILTTIWCPPAWSPV